jgi:hypothetical protein
MRLNYLVVFFDVWTEKSDLWGSLVSEDIPHNSDFVGFIQGPDDGRKSNSSSLEILFFQY